MPLNAFNFTQLMKELDEKQSNLTSQSINIGGDADKMKDLLKELTATNNLLKLMINYKQNYLDPQPIKIPKEPKEKKSKKSEKPIVSYGISGMINK
jgi:hypothetical protein